jgi:hypothetical protein
MRSELGDRNFHIVLGTVLILVVPAHVLTLLGMPDPVTTSVGLSTGVRGSCHTSIYSNWAHGEALNVCH